MAAVNRSYRDFTVVTDIAGYRSSLADVGAVGIGRDYNLVPVQCSTGVFHPKIGLFAAQDGEVRATVGSGNLSFGGWGYNNEVLEVLRPGRDSACFSGLADLIEAIQREAHPGGFLDCLRAPDLHNYVSLARRSSLVPGSGTGRLLHTMADTLTSQIAGLVDELGGAEELTVVSPFFSAHHGIAALAEAVGCDNLRVAVPPRAPSAFDFAAASASGLQVRPVSCDEFNDSRPLHSKLFDIGCRQGRLIVSGSANATVQALGRSNVEAVVARIHDRAPMFGWIAANAQGCQTTGEEAPQEEERASLAVDFDGGVIRGRVMGGGVTAGTWTVSIAWGARREAGPDAVIDEDGYFAFKPPSSFDPMRVGSSVQLILLREAAELRGWLILRGFIDAMNRRGPIARSLGRMIAGVETLNDLTAIMEYVSREPRTFLDAAKRTGGGRSDREQTTGLKVVRPFAAGDAFELSHDGARGSGIVSNGDELIDALVRMLATAAPQENDDSGDDEEEDDLSPQGGSDNRKHGSGKEPKSGGQTQRLRPQVMEMAFNRLFEELVRVPAGPARAPGLFLVFDMIAKIAPRSSLGEELVPRLLTKWLQTAAGSRPVDVDPTGLDECVAATVSRLVIGDPGKTRAMHEFLQAWTGGEVPEEFEVSREPKAGKLNEEALAPGTTQSQWSQTWSSILATKTPWNEMNNLRKALATKGGPYNPPVGANFDEAATISRYSARQGRDDRIVWMESRYGDKPGCPRCGYGFPGVKASKFRRNRIATCDNFRCGRVVIDVSL